MLRCRRGIGKINQVREEEAQTKKNGWQIKTTSNPKREDEEAGEEKIKGKHR